jgi:hypothetical protein
MKRITLLTLVIGMLVFSSCAKKIIVTYQTESKNTGKIVLKPSKATPKTFVTINDNLIVEKKKVKSVTIVNVPHGDYNIHYTSDNSWYKDKLDTELEIKIKDDKEITKLVEVPPYSTGYWVYSSVVFVAVFAILFIPIY